MMTVQQEDFDGNVVTVNATGGKFEKIIIDKLMKEFGCEYLGNGRDTMRRYLDDIHIHPQIMQLFHDRRWKDFFQNVNLCAPYKLPMGKPERIVMTNVPYRKLDQTEGRTEIFLIMRDKEKQMRIECKFQQVSGTAEDKIYRTIADLGQCGTKEAVIVLGGSGFKQASVIGMKNYAHSQHQSISLGFVNASKIFVLREAEFHQYMTAEVANGQRISHGQVSLQANTEMAGW